MYIIDIKNYMDLLVPVGNKIIPFKKAYKYYKDKAKCKAKFGLSTSEYQTLLITLESHFDTLAQIQEPSPVCLPEPVAPLQPSRSPCAPLQPLACTQASSFATHVSRNPNWYDNLPSSTLNQSQSKISNDALLNRRFFDLHEKEPVIPLRMSETHTRAQPF